ncbi:6732_t:CDS:2, partial [Racocetra fulgida]
MSNVYEAIKILDSKEERTALRTLFTNNPEKRAEAERILPTCEDNEEVVSYFKDLLKPESPSKRRKYDEYDDDDEKLERFWNALKDGKVEEHDGGQFLELSRDVSYLLGKDEQVVYHKHNKSPILFSEEGVFSHTEDNIHAFKGYLGNEELFRNLTQEYVRKLYNEWGGIPRFTLFYALNDYQQDLLQRAINSVDDNLLNFVGETTDDNSASHKIVHICTNIPKGEDEGEDGEEGDESVEDVEITEVEDNPGEPSTSPKSPTVTRPDKRKSVIGKEKPFYSMLTL